MLYTCFRMSLHDHDQPYSVQAWGVVPRSTRGDVAFPHVPFLTSLVQFHRGTYTSHGKLFSPIGWNPVSIVLSQDPSRWAIANPRSFSETWRCVATSTRGPRLSHFLTNFR